MAEQTKSLEDLAGSCPPAPVPEGVTPREEAAAKWLHDALRGYWGWADALDDARALLEALDTPDPTWRDVFRTMRAESVRLRPFGDTSDAVDHRVWQLVDRHGNELGHVAHETGYWGEEWTVSFSFECGPSTHIGAAALEPADALELARISGLIGGTS